MAKTVKETRELDGIFVPLSNPDKVYFADLAITKRQILDYYLAVAEGALRGVARRPMILKRFVNGIGAEAFFQKRAPVKRPAWVDVATFKFPSGRHADEIAVSNRAQLAYILSLGCVDLNPHAVRAEDMDRPDELRIDLDPVPGVPWSQILDTARVCKDVLDDHGLVGWPKTSGSRGAHIWVRISPRWAFADVRRAGLALAREVEKRAPAIATAQWWKEQRHGVFVDYNQNARDRTTASAYSLRPVPDARVSMPLPWRDFLACDPAAYTLFTVPALYAAHGDAHAGIDDAVGSIDSLLQLAAEQDAAGPPPERVDMPVITIAQAKQKKDALAGLERWRLRYPDAAAHLQPADVLVDANRGRATVWYRIRVNLVHVPETQRPPQETPDPDYDVRVEWLGETAAPTEE